MSFSERSQSVLVKLLADRTSAVRHSMQTFLSPITIYLSRLSK